MISKEQTTIIQILSDFLNKRKTAIQDDLNFESLIRIAKSQEIEGIVYYQLKDCVTSEKLVPLQKKYAYSLFAYQNRMMVLKKLESAFTKEKISFFIVKGTEVASLYPIPALRSMGDCDVFVDYDDIEFVKTVLKKTGFTEETEVKNVLVYRYGEFEFEFHYNSLDVSDGYTNIHKDFLLNSIKHVRYDNRTFQTSLNENYHFIFLLLHLREHFLAYGVGFRQFMDLAVSVRLWKLDWEWICKELEKMKLFGFTEVCLSLCNKWFGISIPFKIELDDSFVEMSIEHFFLNGVFGFEDKSNLDNVIIRDIISDKQYQGISKIKIIWKKIFPPYDSLKWDQGMKFLNGRSYLLPVAWIWRMLLSLFRGHSIIALKNSSRVLRISSEHVNDRIEYLKKWKLL